MKRFEMTKEQHKKLLSACEPIPMIMLQCGILSSPQEKANAAWKALGKEMGFEHMSVKPIPGQPATIFTAVPTGAQ